MEMTHKKLQKYWDACLIREWRNHGTINSAEHMFKSISGDYVKAFPELLRIPPQGMPRKISIRVFVASNLPMISERLWAQEMDQDVALLRALQESKYTIHKSPTSQMQKEFNNLNSQVKRNSLKVGLNTLAYSNRNRKTDWNIVK